jgi:proteasome accessory factor C
MSTAADRLPRLLALVPYLIARPGIPVEEAAADFGVSARQLRKDLELLWMCGLPGYGPGDLIDLSFEGDTITVTYDAGMRRPLRLTAAEATALLVALRALADTPGIDDPDAVRRALGKVESAAGAARPAGVVVGLAMREEQIIPEVRDAVRDAVQRQRAVRMTYYTASRDEISERIVDPMRVLLVDGRSYLEAWCRSADGVRRFRLDRIEAIEVLAEPAVPPPHAEQQDVSEGLFRPAADQQEAQLVLEPDARWVAEYYPVEDLEELPGGRARVRIRYSDTSWMIRLVLAQAGEVFVEEPAELREGVLDRAKAALRRADSLLAG